MTKMRSKLWINGEEVSKSQPPAADTTTTADVQPTGGPPESRVIDVPYGLFSLSKLVTETEATVKDSALSPSEGAVRSEQWLPTSCRIRHEGC